MDHMDTDCLNRGLAAYKVQDYTQAVSNLEQATIQNQEDYKAFLFLGAAYAGAGRHNAAIGALRRAAELKPEDPRVHYNLGQAYEAAGVPREAFYEYAQAIRINPCYTNAASAYRSLKSRTAAQHGRNMQFSS
jgi:Flp pilus assembly protein TadD